MAASPEAIERRRKRPRERARRLRAEGKPAPLRPPLTEEQKVKQREAGRRYRARNLERSRQKVRQYKKDHPEKHREHERRRRQRMKAEDPEKLRELDRAKGRREAAKPGYKAKRTEQRRRLMRTSPAARERDRAATKRFIHGTPEFAEVFAAMWAEQDGKCYLCAEPLVPGRTTHVEHDHSCCPRGRTCAVCRRGLACERCNHIVGQAHDNPELLRRIADNFEPVLIATRARIAAKTADQLSLWEEEAS